MLCPPTPSLDPSRYRVTLGEGAPGAVHNMFWFFAGAVALVIVPPFVAGLIEGSVRIGADK